MLTLTYCQGSFQTLHQGKRTTVDENIIATIKMRNNFCYPLKMVIFQILLQFLYEFCRLVHGFFSVVLPI